MMLRGTRILLNVNLLWKLGLAIISIFVYCEFLHYYVVISQCQWPVLKPNSADKNIEDNGNHLHAMVLADIHLLGRRNGHWFDKLRREWQMHRAFQTTIGLHRPNIVMFLGDLFDEGKWCTPDEFTEYVSRFHNLFHAPEDIELLIAAGNHDMGFHYSLNPYLVNRFQKAFDAEAVKLLQIQGVTFVIINSMAMEGDDCFLCRPAQTKVKIIARQLKCAKGDKEACIYWKNSSLKQYSQPIILQVCLG
ncbi:Metallophosphoesterase 1 [Halocaridina rubra]|uniref:Metallophosphoesterase 1 n=1 Tax=Halocaridina rubra TaxID=373956 RepID=A0AAN9A1P4_HALRR